MMKRKNAVRDALDALAVFLDAPSSDDTGPYLAYAVLHRAEVGPLFLDADLEEADVEGWRVDFQHYTGMEPKS